MQHKNRLLPVSDFRLMTDETINIAKLTLFVCCKFTEEFLGLVEVYGSKGAVALIQSKRLTPCKVVQYK